MRLWRTAAAQGHPLGLLNLAISHRDGSRGLPRDDAIAVFYFRRSAELGCVQAQAELGRCLFRGVGVAANRVEALEWLERASAQGDAIATHSIGNLLYDEASATFDKAILARAVAWYGKAAVLGSKVSINFLRHLASRGSTQAAGELERLGLE